MTDRTVEIGGERGDGRAVSDLIGFILIFSLVASVVAVVSIAGLDSLQSARDAEQTNNAEKAMDVLADNVADIHDRGAPSRATEVSLGDAQMYMGDPVRVQINDSDGTESFNESFDVRPIVYDGTDDTELVYSMGAVFRVQENGGVVTREWSPRLTSDRVALQVVNTTSKGGGVQSIQGTTVLVRTNSQQRNVVVGDDNYGEEWTIRVDSPRANLWFRMLDSRDSTDCQLNADENRMACEVTAKPGSLYVVENRIVVNIQR